MFRTRSARTASGMPAGQIGMLAGLPSGQLIEMLAWALCRARESGWGDAVEGAS
jgi:hypothetical protein